MAKAKHVVLMMTDQQRRDTLACYGGRYGATPNLDAFANEATAFERAYCACPLCVPTRTSIYTGLMPHKHGAVVNGWTKVEEPYAHPRPDVPLLYERLASHGYRLTHIGVDHVRTIPPIFERIPEMHYVTNRHHKEYLKKQGLAEPDLSYTRAPCLDFDDGKPIMIRYTTPRTGRFPYDAEHFMDMYWAREAEKAIELLKPDEPQFIETLFWTPHVPLVVPEPYYSMFTREDIDLPDTVGKWYDGQPATLLTHIPGHYGVMLQRDQWREPWAVYLGMVKLVDEAIGRVIGALKRRGLWDDALVIFMTDHGDMLGAHSLFQKMCMYEDSTHIPLLVKPPGGRRVERSGSLVSHLDIVATVCEYLDLPALPESDGVSLVPVLEGKAKAVRDQVFIEFNGNSGRGFEQRCLVRGDWKYIYTKGDRDELYNLKDDAGETRNLAGDAAFETTRLELRGRLAAITHGTGNRIEIPN